MLLKPAINRAYYAIFYGAQAALVAERIALPRRHSTLISLFYRHFVEAGRFPREDHANFATIFQLRQRSDYEIATEVSEEDARETVNKAQTFVSRISSLLQEKI
jgi:uncharacterized protein (UPF0332 family)